MKGRQGNRKRLLSWILTILLFVSTWAGDVSAVKANTATENSSVHRFICQPCDVIGNDASGVYFAVTYRIVKAEVWQQAGGTATKIAEGMNQNQGEFEIGGTIDASKAEYNVPLFIRAYYGNGNNEYVDSLSFQRKFANEYSYSHKFTEQPADATTDGYTSFKLGFNPTNISVEKYVGEWKICSKYIFDHKTETGTQTVWSPILNNYITMEVNMGTTPIYATVKSNAFKVNDGSGSTAQGEYQFTRNPVIKRCYSIATSNSIIGTTQQQTATTGVDFLVNFDVKKVILWNNGNSQELHKTFVGNEVLWTAGVTLNSPYPYNLNVYYGDGTFDYVSSVAFSSDAVDKIKFEAQPTVYDRTQGIISYELNLVPSEILFYDENDNYLGNGTCDVYSGLALDKSCICPNEAYGKTCYLKAENVTPDGKKEYARSAKFTIAKPGFLTQPTTANGMAYGSIVYYSLDFEPSKNAEIWLQESNGYKLIQGTKSHCYLYNQATNAAGKTCVIVVNDPKFGEIKSEEFYVYETCIVTFKTNGHGTYGGTTQLIPKGSKASSYEPKDNYCWTFAGWYEDENCTKAFDFNTPINNDVTLYADWKKITATIDDVTIIGSAREDIGTENYIDLHLDGAKFRSDLVQAEGNALSIWGWPDGIELAGITRVDDSHVRIQVRGSSGQRHLPIQNLSNGYVPSSWTDAGVAISIEYNENAKFFIGSEKEVISEIQLTGFPEMIYAGQKATTSFISERVNVPNTDLYDVTDAYWIDPYTSTRATTFEAGKTYILRCVVGLTNEYGYFANTVEATVNGSSDGVNANVLSEEGYSKKVWVDKAYDVVSGEPSFTVSYKDESYDMPLATATTGIGSGETILLPEKLSDEAFAVYGLWKDVDAFSGWMIDGVKYAPGDEYTVWSDAVAMALYEGSVKRTITVVGLDRTMTVTTADKYWSLPNDWPEELGEAPVNKKLAGWYSDFDGQTQYVRINDNGKIRNYACSLNLTGVMETKIYPVWMPIYESENSAMIIRMKFPEDGEQAVLGEIEFASPDLTGSTTTEDYALAYVAQGHYDEADPFLLSADTLAASEAVLAEQSGWYHNGEKFNGTFVKGEQYQLAFYLTSYAGAFGDARAHILNVSDEEEYVYSTGSYVDGSDDQIIRVEVTFTARTNQKDLVEIENAGIILEYEGVGEDCSDAPQIECISGDQFEVCDAWRWYEDDADFGPPYYGADEFTEGSLFWLMMTLEAKEGYKFPVITNNAELAEFLTVCMGPLGLPVGREGTEQNAWFDLDGPGDEKRIDVTLFYRPGAGPDVVDEKTVLSGLELPWPGMTAGTSLEEATLDSDYFNLVASELKWVDADSGNEMKAEDAFRFGGAYYLKARVQPKNGSKAAIPAKGFEVTGYNVDWDLNTVKICNVQATTFNDDGSVDVYAGMNPENSGELSPVAVQAELPTGSVTTYRMYGLTAYAPLYEEEDETLRGAATSIRFASGRRAQARVYASIDGWENWNLLSKGFDGLYPNTEYEVQLSGDLEEAFDVVTVKTDAIPAVLLADGRYPIPEGAFTEENARYAKLTDVTVSHEFERDGGTSIVYEITGSELAGLSNVRAYVTWRKDNGDGTWTTCGGPAELGADGKFTCALPGVVDGDKVYAFVMADSYSAGGTTTMISKVHEAEVPDEFILTIRHNCEFDNNLAMHYVIPQSQLKGYSNIRLMIEMEQYAKNAATPTWKQAELSNPTDYKIGGEDYWHFTFTGIAASEMGNVIKAKVVCEKDGITYESQVDEYSVKAYAYDRLVNSKSATYKTLLVDMLNYGAAAQVHFGKNADNLVNADLTTEQRNLGTPLSQFSATSCENLIGEGTYPAAFEMKNLLYDTNVVLRFRMDFPADYKMDNVKVKFSYVNGKNVTKTRTVPSANFGKSGGKYMVGCEGITPAEMDCVIDATIYDGDKAISQTLQYSIESYVASRIDESESETYKDLMRLMILYGKAAKTHFGYNK